MKQKTVLITGSSRGIGKAAAIKFAMEGYRIVLNCVHSKSQMLNLKKEIESRYKVPCQAILCDVGSYQDVCQLYHKIQTECDGVDILINNAGTSHMGLLSEMSMGEWDDIIRTNLSGAFYCSKLAIPYMVQQKQGKILNISSVWGIAGASCETAYSAAKGGLNTFTRALAKELAPSNIQVNAIACGAFDTEMNCCLDEEEKKALTEEIPAGRFGKPSEAAELAYQLCSGNNYLTGQVISLDGGWI